MPIATSAPLPVALPSAPVNLVPDLSVQAASPPPAPEPSTPVASQLKPPVIQSSTTQPPVPVSLSQAPSQASSSPDWRTELLQQEQPVPVSTSQSTPVPPPNQSSVEPAQVGEMKPPANPSQPSEPPIINHSKSPVPVAQAKPVARPDEHKVPKPDQRDQTNKMTSPKPLSAPPTNKMTSPKPLSAPPKQRPKPTESPKSSHHIARPEKSHLVGVKSSVDTKPDPKIVTDHQAFGQRLDEGPDTGPAVIPNSIIEPDHRTEAEEREAAPSPGSINPNQMPSGPKLAPGEVLVDDDGTIHQG